MTRQNKCLRYEGMAEVGSNVQCVDLSYPVDLMSIKGRIIILLATLDEWYQVEDMPTNVIPISLSGSIVGDDHVILMIASNQQKHVSTDCLWTREFVEGIKDQFRITMTGNGKKHHGSVGQYFGLGTTAKYDMANGSSYGNISTKNCNDVTLRQDYRK